METPASAINPYDILGVSQAVSKAEITKAVAAAMKRKQHSVKVIAEAQKSLMNTQKRILADYLRPILPTIKRFKKENFALLETPAPTLVLLPEFDGLDDAIAKALAEERLENASLSLSGLELVQTGINHCKQENYLEAIQLLEEFSQTNFDSQATEYLQAQMWLVKAYQSSRQIEKAIALCQQLIKNQNPQVQTWATKTLPSLTTTKLAASPGQKQSLVNSLPIAIETFTQGNYRQAVQILEEFCQNYPPKFKEYLEAQMWLIKAYQANGQIEKAIALCHQLASNQNPQVQTWAIKTLSFLSVTKSIQPQIKPNPITLSTALETFKQGNYVEAVKLLEEYCQANSSHQSKEYLQAQMSLVKAYHSAGQIQKAIALCQQLIHYENIQVKTWAKQALESLSAAQVT